MDIECDNCGCNEFFLQDGLTYCKECHSESRAHGHETILDDETIGRFDPNIKIQTLAKKRSKHLRSEKRCDKYISSFTSIDAFSFILKGWTDDLIELGAPVALREIVESLWFTYLEYDGIPVNSGGEEISIGKRPKFRDLQVKILNRKKIYMRRQISQYMNRPRYGDKSKKKPSESVDEVTDERMIKRKRTQRKFSFLSQVAILHASDSESTMATSLDTSCRSEFSMSFSNYSDQSLLEKSLSQASNMSVNGNDSDNNSFDAVSETQLNFPKDAPILNSLPKNKNNVKYDMGVRALLNLLILACIVTEGNTFTLADILYWIDRNAINFKTSVQHLPPVYRLLHEDVKIFQDKSFQYNPFQHFKIRSGIGFLGYQLKLEKAVFPRSSLKPIFIRFLKEFSLPCHLFDILERSLKKSDILSIPQHLFSKKRQRLELFSGDLFVCGMILISLKYFYVLDGVGEYYLSSNARKQNQENPEKSHFVICDWIEKSFHRLHLIVRHSADLHNRFSELFPNVELSATANRLQLLNMTAEVNLLIQEKIQEKNPKIEGHEKRINRLKELTEKNLGFATENLQKPEIDLSKSQTPLCDFSHYVINTSKQKSCELDSDEISIFEDVLKMSSSVIERVACHNESEEIKYNGNFAIVNLKSTKEKANDKKVYGQQMVETIEPAKYYKVDRTYWTLSLKQCHLKPGRTTDLLTFFPENFTKILRYFSAYCGCTPGNLYNVFQRLEVEIFKRDESFFGNRKIGATKRRSGITGFALPTNFCST